LIYNIEAISQRWSWPVHLLIQRFEVYDNEFIGLNGGPAAWALKFAQSTTCKLSLHVIEADGAHAQVITRNGDNVGGVGQAHHTGRALLLN
jgi:hypothetical protein